MFNLISGILTNLFGIGVAGTLVSLLVVFVKGIASAGFFDPSVFPNVVSNTLSNMMLWGNALGGVIPALLGVLLFFVLMRIVVTLL